MIIDLNDEVWGFGGNYYGQLGLEDNKNRRRPTKLNIKAKYISCGDCHTAIIGLNNEVYIFGSNNFGQLGLEDSDNQNKPILIENVKARSVSCGSCHTIILLL